MGRQASRSSSLLATLAVILAISVLITLIGGVWIHWIFFTIPAVVINVRVAAAMGRRRRRRDE